MQRSVSKLARVWLMGAVVAALGTSSRPLRADPWSDEDESEPPVRRAVGDTGLELGAEVRSRALHLASYDLGGRRAGWIEQRLRAHVAVDHEETVRVVVDADALDGVLWGSSSSASALEAQSPGLGQVGIDYTGGEPTSPDSYDLAIVRGDTAHLRHVYGEVWTPVGLLRVGRQPTVEGTTILFADGEGRANRFGAAGTGDATDRVQLTVRPLMPLNADAQRDDRGLSLTAHYDLPSQGEQRFGNGDLHRAGILTRYLAPLPTLEQLYDAQLRTMVAASPDTSTVLGTMSTVLEAKVYQLGVGFEATYVTGTTREQSLVLSRLVGGPAPGQRVNQFGARFVARWDEPAWSAYLEVDYASGDANPSLDSRLERFAFAPDANVGLLLFEHVIAVQTARRARAAAALDSTPFPLSPVSGEPDGEAVTSRMETGGAFTNAVAFFPQADVYPVDDLRLRGGVLLAWTPDGLVDPVASLDSRGSGGEDVNYNGGAPGFIYGTEFDGRVTWSYRQHFYADLEGALLLPGDALHDAEGNADPAGLVEGRVTFVF